MDILEKLPPLEDRLKEVETKLSEPTVASNPDRLRELGRTHSHLKEIVDMGRELRKVVDELNDAKSLLSSDDQDIKELAQDEIPKLEDMESKLVEDFRFLLAPKDPDDEKNTIVEIRSGTGGDEASIFAGDLFRMYARYAETVGWKVEILEEHLNEVGGYKEIVFEIQGNEVFSKMKFEGGVHRVQRVPETESQGRIHTSAATVAVLPEAEEIDIEIPQNEIRVDRFCSSGPGGQSVNTTYSAVRVTHIPTGIVASCQDEKSQIKNLDKAMRVLRARILEKVREEEDQARGNQRKAMVGSGDRSERIRTYNFPQSRVSDHRINFTTHALREILDGGLDILLEPLQSADRLKRMEQA